MRNHRKAVLGAAMLALALVLGACSPGGDGDESSGGSQEQRQITVGVSGSFAEAQITAEMYAQVLEELGYEVKRQLDLKSREISQPAIESGQIDLKPEYLGSLLLHLDKSAAAGADADAEAKLIAGLVKDKGLTLLRPSPASNTNAIVVTKATADKHNLKKVSDLRQVAGQLRFGGPPECPTRPFCIPGLKDKYGVEFREFKPLDVGGPLTVTALEGGEIDVALLFSTSGIISARGFVVLEDDQKLQTAENITPLIRTDALNDEIEEALNQISAKLTTENVTRLNAEVEVERKDPAAVATEFLKAEKLL